MQRHLYLDIETIPAQRPDVMAEIAATIKPPATFKKAESIAAWHETEAPAAIDEAYRKTGLDGAFGQVCVIGWALDDGEPIIQFVEDWAAERSEHRLLSAFASNLKESVPLSDELSTTIIGHNVANFDLRFLVQRSIVNSIRPHGIIARAAQAKPWETERVYDTMVQWAGVARTISLDKLCKALGVPTSKGGITGATVWDEVKAGRIDDVAKYCAADVVATREVHKRLTFADLIDRVQARQAA